jgi:heat shock protein HspQ
MTSTWINYPLDEGRREIYPSFTGEVSAVVLEFRGVVLDIHPLYHNNTLLYNHKITSLTDTIRIHRYLPYIFFP